MSNPMSLDLCSTGRAVINERLCKEELDDATLLVAAAEAAVAEGAATTPRLSVPDVRAFLAETGATLRAGNGDWHAKVECLRRLRGVLMAESDACEAPDATLDAVRRREDDLARLLEQHLKAPLAAAVTDGLSAVAKEACHTVQFLARTLPPRLWRKMCAWFVEPLLRGCAGAGCGVSSEASARCLRYMMGHAAVSPATTGLLLRREHYAHKQPLHRLAAHRSLLEVLYRVGCAKLTGPHTDDVAAAIRSGLCDAMPEVRSVARLLFWCLRGAGGAAAAVADDLFATLSDGERRHVAEAEAAYAAVACVGDLEVQAACTSTVRRGGHGSGHGSGHTTPREGVAAPAAAAAAPLRSLSPPGGGGGGGQAPVVMGVDPQGPYTAG